MNTLSNTLHSNYPKKRATLRAWMISNEYYMAARLMFLAEQYHSGIRKDKVTPEFAHQVDIASYLITLPITKKEAMILTCLAFIHDLVEDYNVADEIILTAMAPETTEEKADAKRIINGAHLLSKKEHVPGGESIDKNKEQYFNDMLEDPLVVLAKCVDGLSNLVDMVGVFNEEKMHYYCEYLSSQHLRIAKIARNKYPQYYMAFQNIKYCINRQLDTVTNILNLLKVVKQQNTPAV